MPYSLHARSAPPPRFILDCHSACELSPPDQAAWARYLQLAQAMGVQHFEVAAASAPADPRAWPIQALSRTGDLTAISVMADPTPSTLARWLQPWLSSRDSIRPQARWHGPSLRRRMLHCLNALGRVQVSVLYLQAPPASVFSDDALGATLADMRAAGVFQQLGVCSDDLDLVATALQEPWVDVVQFRVGTPLQTGHLLALAQAQGKDVVLDGVLEQLALVPPSNPGIAWSSSTLANTALHPCVTGLRTSAGSLEHLQAQLATYMALCVDRRPTLARA